MPFENKVHRDEREESRSISSESTPPVQSNPFMRSDREDVVPTRALTPPVENLRQKQRDDLTKLLEAEEAPELDRVVELLVGLDRDTAVNWSEKLRAKHYQANTWEFQFLDDIVKEGKPSPISNLALSLGLVTEQRTFTVDEDEAAYLLEHDGQKIQEGYLRVSLKLRDEVGERIQDKDDEILTSLFNIVQSKGDLMGDIGEDEPKMKKDVIVDSELNYLFVLIDQYDNLFKTKVNEDIGINPKTWKLSADVRGLIQAVRKWTTGASSLAKAAAFAPGSEFREKIKELEDNNITDINAETATYLINAVNISEDEVFKKFASKLQENTDVLPEEEKEQAKQKAEDQAERMTYFTNLLKFNIDYSIIKEEALKLKASDKDFLENFLAIDQEFRASLLHLKKERQVVIKAILDSEQKNPSIALIELLEFVGGEKKRKSKDITEKLNEIRGEDWNILRRQTTVWNILRPVLKDYSISEIGQQQRKNQNERNDDTISAQIESKPEYWARVLDVELDKHYLNARKDKGKLAQILYEIQTYIKAQGNNPPFTAEEVLRKVKNNSDLRSVLTTKISGKKITIHEDFKTLSIKPADLITFARRGLATHEREIVYVFSKVEGDDLLSMSNYHVFEEKLRRRREEDDPRKKMELSKEMDAFEIDLLPEVIKDVEKELGNTFGDKRTHASVNAISLARRRLAEALAQKSEEREFRHLVGNWELPVIQQRIRKKAVEDEEAMSDKGIQWSAFSVKSMERKVAAAEFRGQHLALNNDLDEAETDKDKEEVVREDVVDIQEAEGQFVRRKASFDQFKAKWDGLFESIFKLIVKVGLIVAANVATMGIGSPFAVAALKFAIVEIGMQLVNIGFNQAFRGQPIVGSNKELMQQGLLTAVTGALSIGIEGAVDSAWVKHIDGTRGSERVVMEATKALTDALYKDFAMYTAEQLITKERAFEETTVMDVVLKGAGAVLQAGMRGWLTHIGRAGMTEMEKVRQDQILRGEVDPDPAPFQGAGGPVGENIGGIINFIMGSNDITEDNMRDKFEEKVQACRADILKIDQSVAGQKLATIGALVEEKLDPRDYTNGTRIYKGIPKELNKLEEEFANTNNTGTILQLFQRLAQVKEYIHKFIDSECDAVVDYKNGLGAETKTMKSNILLLDQLEGDEQERYKAYLGRIESLGILPKKKYKPKDKTSPQWAALRKEMLGYNKKLKIPAGVTLDQVFELEEEIRSHKVTKGSTLKIKKEIKERKKAIKALRPGNL